MIGMQSPLKSSSAAPRTVYASPKRRRHFRFPCVASATVKVGGSKLRSRVLNASEAGAYLEVEKGTKLTPGTEVTLDWSAMPRELKNGSPAGARFKMPATVVRIGSQGEASDAYVIKFRHLVHEQLERQGSTVHKAVVGSLAAALGFLIAYLKIHNFIYFWYDPWLEAYSVGAAAFVLSRVFLSFGYKEPEDRGYCPSISIVIAAKNEQAHIAETIEHCFRSHYPPDLFEVLAVDDGSDDQTWPIMKSLEQKYPKLRTFRFEKNMGKRHAMALGAEKGLGEVLVYVDSDSYIDPESLYRIVQPFADARVGAVSGHVLAAIENDNFISKMEAVRYYVSHRIMKAAESIFGAVTCCPGAFSAYRRSAVVKIVPTWLKQRFLGTAATFGDDRSLTNYILRDYQVIYHAGALCITYVPRTLYQYFRQQLRWKKSWCRETTVAARLMYKKHPIAALFYYLGIVITLVSPLVAMRAMIYLPLVHQASFIPYVLGVFLVSLFLCLIYSYFTQSKYWYYGLAFAALYLFLMSFQNYYAMATVNKNHWGTR